MESVLFLYSLILVGSSENHHLHKSQQLVSYLSTLDKGRQREADLNIQKLLEDINGKTGKNNSNKP